MLTRSALPIDDLVGCIVYSRERGYAGVDDNGDQIEPAGGVVLAEFEAPNAEGEYKRCWRVLNHQRNDPKAQGRFCYEVIQESEVNRSLFAVAERRTLENLYHRLAEHIGTKGPGKRRTGAVDPELFGYHADMDAIRKLLVVR